MTAIGSESSEVFRKRVFTQTTSIMSVFAQVGNNFNDAENVEDNEVIAFEVSDETPVNPVTHRKANATNHRAKVDVDAARRFILHYAGKPKTGVTDDAEDV